MKSTIDLLTDKDKMELADIYDSPSYKYLKKLLDVERLELAKDCLVNPPERLLYLQGKAQAYKDLHKMLQENYKNNKDKL